MQAQRFNLLCLFSLFFPSVTQLSHLSITVDPERARIRLHIEFLLNVHFLVCRPATLLPCLLLIFGYFLLTQLVALVSLWVLHCHDFFKTHSPLASSPNVTYWGLDCQKYEFVWNQQTLIPKPFPSFIAWLLLTIDDLFSFPVF